MAPRGSPWRGGGPPWRPGGLHGTVEIHHAAMVSPWQLLPQIFRIRYHYNMKKVDSSAAATNLPRCLKMIKSVEEICFRERLIILCSVTAEDCVNVEKISR
jgi:hypothetical protein